MTRAFRFVLIGSAALALAWTPGLNSSHLARAQTSVRPITRAYPQGLRSPFAQPTPTAPKPTIQSEEPEPQKTTTTDAPPAFVLAGVVRSRGGATALVVEGGTTHVLRQGDLLAKYRVRHIGERSVELEGTKGSLTLEMANHLSAITGRVPGG